MEEAIEANDLVEVADALADIQYVLSGAVCEFGMATVFKDIFEEVHRSNMSKMCKSTEEVNATQKHYLENKKMESYVEEVAKGRVSCSAKIGQQSVEIGELQSREFENLS